MDPYEDTAISVASQLKQDIRLRLADLMAMNKKSSVTVSQRQVTETTTKTLKSSKPTASMSVAEVASQLGGYKAILNDFDVMIANEQPNKAHTFGPQGYHYDTYVTIF
jgi:hypothetical protein